MCTVVCVACVYAESVRAMLVLGMEEVYRVVVVCVVGHVCGTHVSGIVASAADVLWMSEMRGVGEVCGSVGRLSVLQFLFHYSTGPL